MKSQEQFNPMEHQKVKGYGEVELFEKRSFVRKEVIKHEDELKQKIKESPILKKVLDKSSYIDLAHEEAFSIDGYEMIIINKQKEIDEVNAKLESAKNEINEIKSQKNKVLEKLAYLEESGNDKNLKEYLEKYKTSLSSDFDFDKVLGSDSGIEKAIKNLKPIKMVMEEKDIEMNDEVSEILTEIKEVNHRLQIIKEEGLDSSNLETKANELHEKIESLREKFHEDKKNILILGNSDNIEKLYYNGYSNFIDYADDCGETNCTCSYRIRDVDKARSWVYEKSEEDENINGEFFNTWKLGRFDEMKKEAIEKASRKAEVNQLSTFSQEEIENYIFKNILEGEKLNDRDFVIAKKRGVDISNKSISNLLLSAYLNDKIAFKNFVKIIKNYDSEISEEVFNKLRELEDQKL